MPLLGSAAMLLSFDVQPEAIDEHDRWHTQEHLLERLSIPGFRRGTRWLSTGVGPRYMVLYEVDSLATLASEPYLARLNNPTPWTSKMMPHYRGMNRGLCTVVGSFGFGQGGTAALIRFAPESSQSASLDLWLLEEALPRIPEMPGLGSAHLLRGVQPAAMTNEQRIRGADRGIDTALIITGYDRNAVAACANGLCAAGGLPDRGAVEPSCAMYCWSYSLASAEVVSMPINSEPLQAAALPPDALVGVRPLYHGTRADLKPGDLIAPGYASNYGKRKNATYVYLSATLEAATWGAELALGEGPGRIYIVEPTGPIADDPNLTDKKFPGNPTKSYRTREPLRVIGEVRQWQGHPPEALKAMKDHIEQLRQRGIEAIDD